MKRKAIADEWFYGNKVSQYGIDNGYVDYATLARAFDAVMNNGILEQTCESDIGWWMPVNGIDYDEETEEYHEVFQWFIISQNGAEILETWTDELVYYNEYLDMYLWGVTHWGTAWDYVLTDIKIDPVAYERELNQLLKEMGL